MSLPMYCIWRRRAPCARMPCAASTASRSAFGNCSRARWPGDSVTSCAPSACKACASRLRWLLLGLAWASSVGAVGVSGCLRMSPGLSPCGLRGALPLVCGRGIDSSSQECLAPTYHTLTVTPGTWWQRSVMVATTGDAGADCGRTSRSAHRASVHDLPAGNGDIDGEFLEPRWRKGQGIVTEHHHVGQLPHLEAAEYLLLEAGEGGVDSLAAQGLRHGERLPSRDLLAAERLMGDRGAEVP